MRAETVHEQHDMTRVVRVEERACAIVALRPLGSVLSTCGSQANTIGYLRERGVL